MTGTRLITKPLACAAPLFPEARREAPAGWVRTGRLLLRPLRPGDRDQFLALVRASRGELDRWCPLHRPGETDLQMFDRQLRMTREGDERGLAWRRVAQLADGRLAGAFNLNSIVRGLEFEADANWWVATPLAGRGLGGEGLRGLLRHAFLDLPEGLGLRRVHAGIAPGNLASMRLARSAGFEREPGITSYQNVTGEWAAHDAYAARPETAII